MKILCRALSVCTPPALYIPYKTSSLITGGVEGEGHAKPSIISLRRVGKKT